MGDAPAEPIGGRQRRSACDDALLYSARSCCFEARNRGQLGRLAAAADDKLAVDFGVEPSQLDVSG